jgi:hypothetical protein
VAADAGAAPRARRFTIVDNDAALRSPVQQAEVPLVAPYARPSLRRQPAAGVDVCCSALTAPTASGAPTFALFDAVPSEKGVKPAASAAAPVSPADDELADFLPLLQDYLKISGLPPAAPATAGGASRPRLPLGMAGAGDATRIATDGDDEDYVWDVYYYRPTLTEWNTLAGGNVGSLCVRPRVGAALRADRANAGRASRRRSTIRTRPIPIPSPRMTTTRTRTVSVCALMMYSVVHWVLR